MIFYFSATGNSKYVAERIADALGEQSVSIAQCAANNAYAFQARPGEAVGIVSPTYFWGLPVIVRDFLKKLTLSSSGYVYCVATYGTTTGQAGAFIDRYQPLNARYSVRMPDTWTPVFDLTDAETIAQINLSAEPQIDGVIERIKSRETGDFMQNKIPMPLAKAFYATYDIQRRTARFSVESNCTGCGLCAKKCPVNAIEMRYGKPVFVKDRCALCLGCLHRCPSFAIQYGKNTKKHGQYANPHTRV